LAQADVLVISSSRAAIVLFSKADAPWRGKRNDLRHTGQDACSFLQHWKYDSMHARQNVCWQLGSNFGCDNLFQHIGHCSSLFIFAIISNVASFLHENTKQKQLIIDEKNNRILSKTNCKHSVLRKMIR